MDWDQVKYDTYYYPAIWKTSKTKKFIGLDHQVALGKDGISLNDFYANYASSEGSNLDGGKTSSGSTVPADDPKTTTSTSTTTTTTVTTTSTTSIEGVSNRLYGDSNLDGEVDLSDAILIMQSLANPDKYQIRPELRVNADVYERGSGITANDALAIQKYLLGLLPALPES